MAPPGLGSGGSGQVGAPSFFCFLLLGQGPDVPLTEDEENPLFSSGPGTVVTRDCGWAVISPGLATWDCGWTMVSPGQGSGGTGGVLSHFVPGLEEANRPGASCINGIYAQKCCVRLLQCLQKRNLP